MRRIVMWLSSTAVLVVLMFGYHTSTPQAALDAILAQGAAPVTRTTTSADGSQQSTTTTTGPTVSTQWGPVQVQITTTGTKITDVTVLQQPSGNQRDVQINAFAVPRLVDATLAAQNAQIDMVSGATVTSTGYLQSLQAALDQVGA